MSSGGSYGAFDGNSEVAALGRRVAAGLSRLAAVAVATAAPTTSWALSPSPSHVSGDVVVRDSWDIADEDVRIDTTNVVVGDLTVDRQQEVNIASPSGDTRRTTKQAAGSPLPTSPTWIAPRTPIAHGPSAPSPCTISPAFHWQRPRASDDERCPGARTTFHPHDRPATRSRAPPR